MSLRANCEIYRSVFEFNVGYEGSAANIQDAPDPVILDTITITGNRANKSGTIATILCDIQAYDITCIRNQAEWAPCISTQRGSLFVNRTYVYGNLAFAQGSYVAQEIHTSK